MTGLRDQFEVVHKREDKFDYVTWSQVADRLDEAEGSNWSFEIVQFGGDFVHGRLRIGDRTYENIGYAENADANWKKEPLKDAASDAFKRCAALAGVARYLYDKDDSHAGARPAATRQAAPPPRPVALPHRVNTDVPPVDEDWIPPSDAAEFPPIGQGFTDTHCNCGQPWSERSEPGDKWHKAADGYHRHPDNVRKARAVR